MFLTMMPMYYLDRWYFILVLPTLFLAMGAQFLVKNRFAKYRQIPTQRGRTGQETAKQIMRDAGILNVSVERVPGQLSDHYSPREKVLRLSEPVYDSASIAAIGVAAHEAGHAIQDAENYLPNRIRGGIAPVAGLASQAGPYLAIFGLMMRADFLFKLGIFLYMIAVAFYLVTLPVEFDASRRAIRILEEDGYLNDEELRGAKSVLGAAAMTYVASTLTAFASLARLILLRRQQRR